MPARTDRATPARKSSCGAARRETLCPSLLEWCQQLSIHLPADPTGESRLIPHLRLHSTEVTAWLMHELAESDAALYYRPLTPSGPRTVMLNNLGGWPHSGNVANRNWDSWSWSFFEPTSFSSVSDRCPTPVVTKRVRSERCAPKTGGDRGHIAHESPSATGR